MSTELTFQNHIWMVNPRRLDSCRQQVHLKVRAVLSSYRMLINGKRQNELFEILLIHLQSLEWRKNVDCAVLEELGSRTLRLQSKTGQTL